MATIAETRALNAEFMEQLQTPGFEKRAADAATDFTRTRIREDGVARRVMPPIKVENDELTRQVETDKPSIVIDKEADSPASISVPFGTQPDSVYIQGPRYRVNFHRILTPRFTKDVTELRTWQMDIRAVMSDNAIKDMLAEEDSKFFRAVGNALVAADTPVPWSGVPQWETIPGGITRDTLEDAFKILPRTPAHLEVATVVCNNVSIKDVQKFPRDEAGGDMSQDLLRDGWSMTRFMNADWIITIKRDLVPDDSIFMFSSPAFIGKLLTLEDTSMFIKKEAFMLEFYAYEEIGGTIAHTGGIARADFA